MFIAPPINLFVHPTLLLSPSSIAFSIPFHFRIPLLCVNKSIFGSFFFCPVWLAGQQFAAVVVLCLFVENWLPTFGGFHCCSRAASTTKKGTHNCHGE